ncbi:MAG: ThiF family adenylyltransferase [Candidatus Binatia bacterium]
MDRTLGSHLTTKIKSPFVRSSLDFYSFCVVGVGRTGSLVATSLARMGIRQLTLIDPDRLELHNLDAMDSLTTHDLGTLNAALLTTAIPDSITTLRAFVSAKEADVVICCADNDGARLAAGVIAAVYAKPLLDIGTGVFGTAEARRMGADIRLILPADRCLLCCGGITDVEQARQIFMAQPVAPRQPWNEERAGSLRSLNQIAAHIGLRVLEDFISERVQESRWLRLEFDAQGFPSVQVITPPPALTCPLCRHRGHGDGGLIAVREILSFWPDR